MKIKDLKPADYNPRTITDEQLERLKKSIQEFGDLSGIVFNRRTDNLVGGHQRLKCLPPDAKIEKKKLTKPSRTGTVAEGYIIIPSSVITAEAGIQKEERYSYREVDWPVEKEKAANIAANQQGGEFDDERLATLIKELSELPDFDAGITGFGPQEIDDILNSFEEDKKNKKAEYPITAKLFESYNYLLVYTTNITDHIFLENMFDLKIHKSYKSSKSGITRVIDFETFIKKLNK